MSISNSLRYLWLLLENVLYMAAGVDDVGTKMGKKKKLRVASEDEIEFSLPTEV